MFSSFSSWQQTIHLTLSVLRYIPKVPVTAVSTTLQALVLRWTVSVRNFHVLVKPEAGQIPH